MKKTTYQIVYNDFGLSSTREAGPKYRDSGIVDQPETEQEWEQAQQGQDEKGTVGY